MSDETFSGFAIVEQMGHVRYVGMVREVTLAGAGMLRVDVPELPEEDGFPAIPGYVKFVSPSSLYALTPCTEEQVMKALKASRPYTYTRGVPMIEAKSDPWVEGQEYNPYREGDDDPHGLDKDDYGNEDDLPDADEDIDENLDANDNGPVLPDGLRW